MAERLRKDPFEPPSASGASRRLEREAAGCCARSDSSQALAIGRGLAAAVVASSCCTVPALVLLVAGAGSGLLSGVAFLPRYAPPAGAVLLLAFLVWEVRRRGNGALSVEGLRRTRPAIVGGLLAFALGWFVMTNILTPALIETAVATRTPSTGGPPGAVAGPQRPLLLEIKGMYCPACVALEESVLSGVDGVSRADVWMGGARVTYNPKVVTPEEIRRAATFYRFRASIVENGERAAQGRRADRPDYRTVHAGDDWPWSLRDGSNLTATTIL